MQHFLVFLQSELSHMSHAVTEWHGWGKSLASLFPSLVRSDKDGERAWPYFFSWSDLL